MNQWNDLVGPGRTDCTSVLMCVWLRTHLRDFEGVIRIRCSDCLVIISFSLSVKIYYNDGGRHVFVLVDWMERSRWHCTNSLYNFTFIWLSLLIQCVFIISIHSLSKYYTGVGVCLSWLNRWNNVVVQMLRLYFCVIDWLTSIVLLGFDPVLYHHHLTSLYVCNPMHVLDFLKLLFVLDLVWSHNITLIPCQNT